MELPQVKTELTRQIESSLIGLASSDDIKTWGDSSLGTLYAWSNVMTQEQAEYASNLITQMQQPLHPAILKKAELLWIEANEFYNSLQKSHIVAGCFGLVLLIRRNQFWEYMSEHPELRGCLK